ncbi:hypothetical protein BDR05DRAFT_959325 [Suillus weaverae]|nr:hypothetical protein BDR05DRAFT_959325 [Suillus weaverae]
MVDMFANRMAIVTESGPHTAELRLLARLEQPFGALVLVQHRGAEYKRITLISHEWGT